MSHEICINSFTRLSCRGCAAAGIDCVCVPWGVAAGSWCIVGGTMPRKLSAGFFRSLLSFITPSHLASQPSSPRSLSISATIALSAIWSSKHLPPPPSPDLSLALSHPSSLSVCVSFTLLSPSPAGCCCGQTSRSNLSLPRLCLPSIDSTFPVLRRYSHISVCGSLARFIWVISSPCFCYKCVGYGPDIIIISVMFILTSQSRSFQVSRNATICTLSVK